jgi:hypothetical protein
VIVAVVVLLMIVIPTVGDVGVGGGDDIFV